MHGIRNDDLPELACYMENVSNPPLSTWDAASIKNGDQAAFLSVYHTLHIKVYRFFLKKVRLPEDARELTQQTFIRLWQFRHTLSELHSLDKQLFIIAHSQLVNHFEKQTVQKKLKIQQQNAAAMTKQAVDQHGVFELSNSLHVAIDKLPPVRKKILILKAFHNYNNKEIADEMAISVKTVEHHITKAFRRMKRMMTILAVLMYSFL